MTYNITNITASTDLYTWLYATNELSGGLFTIIVLLAVFLIMFFFTLTRDNDPLPAFGAATFLTSIIGILFIVLGFIKPAWLGFFIIPMAGVIVGAFVRQHKGD